MPPPRGALHPMLPKPPHLPFDGLFLKPHSSQSQGPKPPLSLPFGALHPTGPL